jgi:plastocyanin
VRWTWNSAHCHSVQSDGSFNSGFFYPTQAPTSPRVVPDFFEYPVPELAPTLTYTRLFQTAGMFVYYCIHHQNIGMRGVVIVE